MYGNEKCLNSLKNNRNKLKLERKINNKKAYRLSISNCLNKKGTKRQIIIIKNYNYSKRDSDNASTNSISNNFDTDSFNKIYDTQDIYNIEEKEKNSLSERIYNKDINDKNKIKSEIENKILLVGEKKKSKNKNYNNNSHAQSDDNCIIINKEKNPEMNKKIFIIKNQKKNNDLYLINKNKNKNSSNVSNININDNIKIENKNMNNKNNNNFKLNKIKDNNNNIIKNEKKRGRYF